MTARRVLPPRTRRHAHHSRLRRIMGLLGLLGLVSGIFVYRHFTDPERVRLAALDYLQSLVRGTVSVQSAEFSLFDGVRLSGVSIAKPIDPGNGRQAQAPDGNGRPATEASDTSRPPPLFTCPSIRLRYRLAPALMGRLEVEEIVATAPTLTVHRDNQTDAQDFWRLLREPRRGSAPAMGPLPTVRLRESKIRITRRNQDELETIEELTLNVLATTTGRHGIYEMAWAGGGATRSQGRFRLNPRTGTVTDIDGGLPWLRVEGVALAADAGIPGVQQRCDLLGLTGELRIRDFHLSAGTAESVGDAAAPDSDVDAPVSSPTGRSQTVADAPTSDHPKATIELRNATLAVPLDDADRSLPADKRYLRFTGVHGRLDVTADAATAVLSARFRGSACTLRAQLFRGPTEPFSLADVGFDLKVSVERLELPRRDDPTAPQQAAFVNRWRPVRHFYNDFDPHGLVNLQMSVARQPGADAAIELRHLTLEGLDCDASYRRFPYRVRDLSGSVEYGPDGVLLKDLTGSHAAGRITVNGTLSRPRWFAATDLNITGRNIPTDRPLHDALSPRYRQIWDLFDPMGSTDIDVRLTRSEGTPERGEPWDTIVDARLNEVTAQFTGFPYPFERVVGTLRVEHDVLSVADLTGYSGRGRVAVNGSARFDDRGTEALDLRLEAADIAFDDRLKGALPGSAAALVTQFDPRGTFDLAGALTLDRARGPLVYDLVASLNAADLAYHHLPIPVEDVTGRIRLQPDRITLNGITGHHGPTQILAEGSLDVGPQTPDGRLTVACNNLVLDAALRQALPETIRPALEQLTLAGPFDSVTVAEWTAGGDRGGHQRTTLTARGVDLHHDAFPLAISDVRGTLTLDADRATFDNLTGRCGQAGLSLSGEVARDADHLGATLDLSVTDMPFNEQLRQALPWRFRRSWNNLRPAGRFDLALHHLGIRRPVSGGPTEWDFAGALTLHEAGFDLGARVRNVSGTLLLDGASSGTSAGSDLSVSGSVRLDHLDLNDHRVTQLTGRIANLPSNRKFVLGDLRGETYGGSVVGEVEVNYATQPAEYSCAATLAGLDLEALSRSPAGTQPGQADAGSPGDDQDHSASASAMASRSAQAPTTAPSGRTDAHLYLTGAIGEPARTRGGGRVRIEDARLFRLPLMLSILDAVDQLGPARSAQQTATAEFFLLGRNIELHDVLIQDPTLALIGGGRIERDPTALDLRLVAVSPNRRLTVPLLTEFLEGTARELIEIRVKGAWAEPTVTARPLRSIEGAARTLLSRPRTPTAEPHNPP